MSHQATIGPIRMTDKALLKRATAIHKRPGNKRGLRDIYTELSLRKWAKDNGYAVRSLDRGSTFVFEKPQGQEHELTSEQGWDKFVGQITNSVFTQMKEAEFNKAAQRRVTKKEVYQAIAKVLYELATSK